jgi:hypothetical protein
MTEPVLTASLRAERQFIGVSKRVGLTDFYAARIVNRIINGPWIADDSQKIYQHGA